MSDWDEYNFDDLDFSDSQEINQFDTNEKKEDNEKISFPNCDNKHEEIPISQEALMLQLSHILSLFNTSSKKSCNNLLINHSDNSNGLPKISKKKPKRIVDLDDNEKEFKDQFYSHFTKRKKFKKEFVFQIHELFLMKRFNFEKMTREECRRIDLYFQKYAKHKESILDFLKQNKAEINRVVFKKTF